MDDTRTVFRNISDTFSSRPQVVYFEWMCDLISRMFSARALTNNESSPKTFNYWKGILTILRSCTGGVLRCSKITYSDIVDIVHCIKHNYWTQSAKSMAIRQFRTIIYCLLIRVLFTSIYLLWNSSKNIFMISKFQCYVVGPLKHLHNVL